MRDEHTMAIVRRLCDLWAEPVNRLPLVTGLLNMALAENDPQGRSALLGIADVVGPRTDADYAASPDLGPR